MRYDLYDSNATLQGKLLTGGSGYDVGVSEAWSTPGKQIQAGIFQPLDKSRLPNPRPYRPADPRGGGGRRPGQSPPRALHVVSTTGVAINVDKVMKALDGRLPGNAWDPVFDPPRSPRA